MRGFKLNIGLDVDEIVYECIQYALNLMNKKYDITPPVTMDEITAWGKTGGRGDIIFECFSDPHFYETQPLIKGAKEFVHKLSKIANVYFVTAIDPEFMGIRIKRLLSDFPEVPKENIIMTSSKNVINLDILFDDGAHNILKSIAKYPILKRMPWNSDLTGYLAVNNYEEFFTIIKEIQKNSIETEKPDIIALVGPTGSGKKEIAKELISMSTFKKPVAYTNRAKYENEVNGKDYHFISTKEFQDRKNSGDFFETTAYAGYYYGTKKEAIDDILKEGKQVVIPLDICGAMTLKNNYPNVCTVFVKRDKKTLLSSLLNRNISNEEKIARILSLETEEKNIELCDIILNNREDIRTVTNSLLTQIQALRE